jgi:6-phosphogluconolactonase
MKTNTRLEVLASADALANHVAEWLLTQALAKEGAFAICLSGGATPRRLYERLAEPPFRDRFPWARAHLFFGDERFAPHDDPRSNYGMVRSALLSRAPIPPQNVHAVPVEGRPADAAAAYERDLKSFYGAEVLDPARPLFDAVLLGLGEDGHIASLFPGTPALCERGRWAVAAEGARPEPRITLTYPALESSAQAAFLVSGEAKRAILGRLRGRDQSLPASHFSPDGALFIFADEAAAAGPA